MRGYVADPELFDAPSIVSAPRLGHAQLTTHVFRPRWGIDNVAWLLSARRITVGVGTRAVGGTTFVLAVALGVDLQPDRDGFGSFEVDDYRIAAST